MTIIMLDVDGVLVCGRPQDGKHFFTDLEADLGLSPDLLRRRFFQPYWEGIVTGRDALPARLAAVLAEIAPDITVDRLTRYWFENDSRIDAVVLAEVQALRSAGTKVFLATNQEHLRARYLMDDMDLGSHVDGMFYSAALGCRKPEPEFYRRVAQGAGTTADDLVLVDDTLANVEAARNAGWRALHWTGTASLAAASALAS